MIICSSHFITHLWFCEGMKSEPYSICSSLTKKKLCPVVFIQYAQWMYFDKNLRWKSLRMVSLMNRFFSSGASRAWFLNTTSSSHLIVNKLFVNTTQVSKRRAPKNRQKTNLLFNPTKPDPMSGLPASMDSSCDFFSFSIRCSSCKMRQCCLLTELHKWQT